MNAGFVVAASTTHGPGPRAAHHLYDFGHFALLGVLAGLLRLAAVSVSARLRSCGVAWGLAVVLLAPLATVIARDDLTNFMERTTLPAWVPLRALEGLALAALYVACARGLAWLVPRSPRLSGVVGTLVAVAAVNRLLSPNYEGPRVLLMALGARFSAEEVTRNARSARADLALRVAGALTLLSGSLVLLLRPAASTWPHLFEIRGALAARMLGDLIGPRGRSPGSWVPRDSAAWFHDLAKEPERRASGALTLPKDALVVLVTIDAVRADVVWDHKHDALLPNLAALAKSSVRFTNARSPSPSTQTTVIALLTSRYYSQQYWRDVGKTIIPLEDQSPRWTMRLSERGVHTAHVVAVRGLGAQNGIGRGFDTERLCSEQYAHAAEVGNLILEELDQRAAGPGFIFAHFIDPHAPYDRGGKVGTPFERYLAEVAVVDRELGRILQKLDEPRFRGRAVLIASSDHGEAFGEHDSEYHASSLYDELLRVPLLIRAPGVTPKDVKAPVSLMDLGPTILDLYGLPTPGQYMGESLAPLLVGKAVKLTRPIVADGARRIQSMVFADGVKAISDLDHQAAEVYDLNHDPGELDNRLGDEDFPSYRYVDALTYFFDVHTLKRDGWQPPRRKY
jgi:hypothetical protein